MTRLGKQIDRAGQRIARTARTFLAIGSATLACAGLNESDLEPSGMRVEGNAGTYSIEIPNDDWLRVPVQDEGDVKPDFQLARKGASGWINAWSRREPRLEDIVVNRRSALLQAGLINYQETRYFLSSSPRITASLSRYIVGGEVVLALVAVQPPFVVELVAGASRAAGTEREIIQILESIRFGGNRGLP